MSVESAIVVASPEEWLAALRLLFQHLALPDQERRLQNALHLLRLGELDPKGLFVERGPTGVTGSIVALPLPGATALVWPPQACVKPPQPVEDRLVRHAVAWLVEAGARLGQCLLHPDEVRLGDALLRNGFQRITSLWYFRHFLDLPTPLFNSPSSLLLIPYEDADPGVFLQTLERTYEGSQDCPEVNGVRTMKETLAGHRATSNVDADLWWLAVQQDKPVGVLLMTQVADLHGLDVAYVGVVPEWRGRGLGRELMLTALFEARTREATQVTLSVDARNLPAWGLYRGLGFEPFDVREVFLAVWNRESSAAAP